MLNVIAICIGASIGAVSRWALGLWLTTPGALIPWGTFAANMVGGYLVGIAVGTFQLMPNIDPIWRLALITGFLGGLTTFSSFSAEVILMMTEQRFGLAAFTAAAHVAGSLLLTYAGMRTVMLLSQQ